MRTRILTVAAAALIVPVLLQAQIPVRRGAVDPDARILVANPQVSGDAGDAVKIGNGLRDRMARVAGRKYTVVSRDIMNIALTHFGYKEDDILPPAAITALAEQVKAGIVVVSELSGAPGAYSVKIMVSGGGKSFEGSVSQASGQGLDALGAAAAELLKGTIG